MKFEDTKLLDHPAVRDAYELISTFFSDADDFVKMAVRTGEIISVMAQKPDPDVIAACIIVDSRVAPIIDIDSLNEFISERTADYLQLFNSMDVDNPVYTDDGARQFSLTHAALMLAETRRTIASGALVGVTETAEKVELLEKNIHAAEDTPEQGLVLRALSELGETHDALQALIDRRNAAAAFDNSGLPPHPTLIAAHQRIRAEERENDPAFNSYTRTGMGIARVLFETGASTDPDVLGAALLNQYWEKRYGNLEDNGFSSRLAELYRETSAWASDRPERSAEGAMIVDAAHLHSLETDTAFYQKAAGHLPEESAYRVLEILEDLLKSTSDAVKDTTHPALKARMEKAVAAAKKILHTPENKEIRKPGSPRRDMGWT